jgi:hypothetical protein
MPRVLAVVSAARSSVAQYPELGVAHGTPYHHAAVAFLELAHNKPMKLTVAFGARSLSAIR